eukprot:CAMPEP_0114584600 /NCGR_PEP_ID=MMETSP0125-20121206/8269_1 /TAXON_ID=485358 ORGANISM="Aristerostoma sp., Strain ATCC 50986" /NCGR_SAMPLE_ID=MMETSP0125 /ASSEMBLY_ACC=CAM_ASM_000245 /LENGTH=138 /DNA_ID=CAMNT_0001779091 /DNA_START=835 /DNA_END=1248 /DNA_ORIENTATION=+
MGIKSDDILLNSLDKYYMEAQKGSTVIDNYGTATSKNSGAKLLEDPVLKYCPNLQTNEAESSDEESVSEKSTPNQSPLIRPLSNPDDSKQDCIICMEKIREIVFLPCCHFLTCPLCAPKVPKCPMCKKKIEKNLKIYW